MVATARYEGRAEGMLMEIHKIICTTHSNGLDIETIARYTGMAEAEVDGLLQAPNFLGITGG
ncbi:hypothetical protein CL176_01095 [Suicoccus acidiformans]|uniref:Uncharacterized protein n=1 Tax=Suicoccus acidiformans TaxID=2036206 RepID=A0A347WI29_9LACT|nr:hypothetical protein CL176_01095 [Suicoccus acidiformans]